MEILLGIRYGGDGNKRVRRVTKVEASTMARMRALSGNKSAMTMMPKAKSHYQIHTFPLAVLNCWDKSRWIQ